MCWVKASQISWQLYLKEQAEADPLVVLVVSPLERVLCLVHTRVRHIEPDPLPEGTGYGVRGVDPTVCIQYILHMEKESMTINVKNLSNLLFQLFTSDAKGFSLNNTLLSSSGQFSFNLDKFLRPPMTFGERKCKCIRENFTVATLDSSQVCLSKSRKLQRKFLHTQLHDIRW